VLQLILAVVDPSSNCSAPPLVPSEVWQPLVGAGVVLANALAGYLIYKSHQQETPPK